MKSSTYWCKSIFANWYTAHKRLKETKYSPTKQCGCLLTITYKGLPNSKAWQTFKVYSQLASASAAASMLANWYHTHFQHQRQCQHFVQGFLMLTLLLTLTVNRPLEKTRIFQSTHANIPARHTHLENKIKLAFLNLLLTLTLSTVIT